MTPSAPAPAGDPAAEIPRLIETLLAAERRLVELTAGEVDAVAGRDGRTFLLQRAQEQLRQSEAVKQAAILNALPAHIALLDAQGLIISVNEAWRRFGRSGGMASQRQAEGMNYLSICDETRGAELPDAQRTAAGVRSVLAGTAPSFSLEYPCHAPAEERWFMMLVTPLQVDHLVGAVVMHVNITERKQAEISLRAGEREQRHLAERLEIETARFAEAQTVANVGSWETDLATLSLYWSDETFRIFETDRGHFQPTHEGFLALVHPDDRATVDRAFIASLHQTGHCSLEHRLLLPGGRIKFVEERWRPQVDEQGKPVRVFGTCHDITARRQAEAAMRESNEKFEQLANTISDVFWIRSADMRKVHYVSPAFEQIWGRPVASLYARPQEWADFIAPEDRQRVLASFAALQDAARVLDLEYRIVRPDGEIRWVHARGFQILDAGNRLIRHAGIVTDITERKQLEEQLRQAHKLEAIGTLAGGIAHDFNNLLAAIGGYTELALMKLPDNPGVREHLGAVVAAVKRAADLVRQILTFSRDQPLERRQIQLTPVVTECVKLLRGTMPVTIKLDLVVGADVPTVLADETQVHQILMNLGTNARHALGDRPGRIELKVEGCLVDPAHAVVHAQLRPGRYARVSVSDTGSGMDAETLRRIFEPFFTTKAPGKGTGLGLAVVHGIMDSHDGVITVHSQPGEGTVFRLYFPAQTAGLALAPPAELTGPRGHGERVLLVDDEELLTEIGEQALRALGYEVTATRQPAEAVALMRADPARFALVLTDQAMPGMTGLQLAAELRRIRPDLPIILTTGYSLTLTAERVRAARIQQLLLKPTTIHSLGAAVHAALSCQPLATHASNPPY